jgi:putative NADPH-quinone reductase
MKISIILGHPRRDSFNHALANAAADTLRAQGHEPRLHDLHAEGFDPVLPAGEEPRGASLPHLIELHCREIAEVDGIVVVHPNWWGMPPAIVTGWVDRVLRPEVAYRFLEGDAGDGVPQGLLRAKTAIVLNTANTLPEREARVFGDPLQRIWRDCVFGLCGIERFERRTFTPIVTSTAAMRTAWLEQARAMIERAWPRS